MARLFFVVLASFAVQSAAFAGECRVYSRGDLVPGFIEIARESGKFRFTLVSEKLGTRSVPTAQQTRRRDSIRNEYVRFADGKTMVFTTEGRAEKWSAFEMDVYGESTSSYDLIPNESLGCGEEPV